MNRLQVFDLINEERDYQDSLIAKGRFEKSMHTVGEEILMIHQYAHIAEKAWTEHFGDKDGLDIVRKIAALAVRCMENSDTPPREKA